jgi:hypothetical protein
MKNPIAKLSKLIKKKRFKEAMIIYVLFNIGILFTIYGTVLYSPALIPDIDEMSPEGARLEIINMTRGAFISQEFGLDQYNIGFDMMNFGGIFLIIGLLFQNNIESGMLKKRRKAPRFRVYRLRKKGSFQGNILEWLCLVIFSFAFFTFLQNIFVHIIIISFVIGVIGFSIRKLHTIELFPKSSRV